MSTLPETLIFLLLHANTLGKVYDEPWPCLHIEPESEGDTESNDAVGIDISACIAHYTIGKNREKGSDRIRQGQTQPRRNTCSSQYPPKQKRPRKRQNQWRIRSMPNQATGT